MQKLLQGCFSTTCLTALVLISGHAYANPEGGVVAAGSASIAASASKLDVTQHSDKVVIDWRGFDIAPSEHTEFHQPTNQSLAINRVNSTSPTVIAGKLSANGNVVVINQNGVSFTGTSVVDVNGLIATTADIDTARAMAGDLHFDKPGNPSAAVVNEGTITAKDAGLVGLVAPTVQNSGTITAKLGRVHLASGDTMTVDLYGDGLLEVKASDALTHQLVENTGVIRADGGTIAMTAAAGRSAVDSVVKVSGELHATSVGVRNGKIIIAAEGSNAVAGNVTAEKGKKSGVSTVLVDGTLNVSGNTAGERGGSVEIFGDHIAVMDGAQIDASGANSGGIIHVGGQYLGQGETPTALITIVQAGAALNANARMEGNGGEVIVYADNRTEFYGSIEANGAGDNGNGGFVETSGKNALLSFGQVRVIAGRNGKAGSWLLDPADITITAATTSNAGGSPNWTATNTGSQVSAATIVTSLNAGTNVTVTTTNDAFAGNGDIFVNSAITTTGTGSLTLSAYRNITVSSTITLNGGTLTLRANNAGAADGSTGAGAITVNAAIGTAGGNIIMGGGNGAIAGVALNADGTLNTAAVGYAVGSSGGSGILINANVNAGGGNIILNGRGNLTATADRNYGVAINTNTVQTSGTVQVSGIGGGTGISNHNYGYSMSAVGTLRTSGAGLLTVYGVGGNATGSGERQYGVGMNTGIVEATGAGAVRLTGIGGNNSGSGIANFGVLVAGNASFVRGNGGDVVVRGIAGTSLGSSNFGINVYGGNITNSGALTIVGTGGGSGVSSTNIGVFVEQPGGNITTSGGGALTITGNGGNLAGTAGSNHGIRSDIANGIQTTGTGNITLNGTRGGQASSFGISVPVANGIITAGTAGNISLLADTVSFNLANNVTAIGSLTIAPLTGGASMAVGTTGSVLNLSNTDLSYLTAGSYIFGSTTTGNLTVNTTRNFGAANVRYLSGADVSVSGALTTLGSGSHTFSAYRNITVSAAITLQGGSLVLQANNADMGTGRVFVSANISTNGGDITMGGGSNIATGFAIGNIGSGNVTDDNGVTISSTILNAGGGNIRIRGRGAAESDSNNIGIFINTAITTSGNGVIDIVGVGGAGVSDNIGVFIETTADISHTGSGAITINGTGGAGTGDDNYGVRVSADIINSATGGITITGTGGGVGASINNYGIIIRDTAAVTTAAGDILLNGTGGGVVATSSGNFGIATSLTGALVQTGGAGNITVNGIGGPGSNSVGFTANFSSSNIMRNTGSGNIIINADTINFVAGAQFITPNTFTLRPYSASSTIGIGVSGFNLNVGNTALGTISAANIVLGATNSGNMTINTTRDFGAANVSFISGGNISLGGTLTKATGAGAANYLFQANGNITNSGSAGVNATTGAINLTMTSDNDVSGAGSITLTTAPLTVNGGTITLNSNGQSVTQSGSIGGDETINSGNGAVSIGALNGDTAGTRSLTVNAGTATFTTTAAIGGTNKLNNMTLNANDVVLGANIGGTGTLTIQPTTQNRRVQINFGSADGTNLNLSSTEVGYFVNGWTAINIGRTDSTNDIYIGSTSWSDPINFRNPFSINIPGTITTTDNATVTFTAASNGTNFTGGGISADGAVTFGGFVTASSAASIATTNDNISFTTISAASNLAINAGTGTVAFGNIVNGAGNKTVTGGSITFSGAWGGSTPVGDVTLTSTNSLSLPAITTAAGKTVNVTVTGAGNSITTTGAISTGAAGNITLTSDDLVLGGNLSGTGTLTLRPNSNASEVRLNDATAGGTYSLSSTEMGYFVDGWSGITIGNSTGSGSIYMGATSWTDPITFLNNFRVNVGGNITASGNSSITFTVGNSGWVNMFGTFTTAGQNVTMNTAIMTSVQNITTNGGLITVNGIAQVSGTISSATWSTSGGNITITGALSRNTTGGSAAARTLTLNAGTGAVSLGGTINGDYNLSVTGSTIGFAGAIGGTEALGDITLTSVNSLSLPAITTAAGKTVNATVTGAGNSITTTGAIATGAAGNITLTADDLILLGNLSGTGILTIQTNANTRVMNFNRGAADGTNFNVSTTELGYFVDGWSSILIGKSSGMSPPAYMDFGATTWNDPVTFRGWYTRIYATLTALGNASVSFTGSGAELNMNGTAVTTQGQAISFTNGFAAWTGGSSPSINSNGGNITLGGVTMGNAVTMGTISILSGGGNIAFTNAANNISPGNLTSGSFNINAGTGNVSFAGSVNTLGNVTVTGNTITMTGAWGASTNLGNVTLNATNSMVLRAITTAAGRTVNVNVTGAGNSITTTGAISTGAAGNITLTSDDLVLGANLSGTGTLTLQPNSTTRTMRINNGTADGTNWHLSTAEVTRIVDGWSSILLGRSDATSDYFYIGASTWNDPVTFRGRIAVANGAIVGSGNAGIIFNPVSHAEAYAGGGITTQGQSITYQRALRLFNPSSIFTINSNGGDISFTSISANFENVGINVLTGGGNLSLSGAISSTSSASNVLQSVTLNAGSGTLSFGSTVNGSTVGIFNLTASGATITTNGSWGATTPLSAVSLTSTNGLTLPSIAASSIFARTTGAASDLTLAAGRTLTASGSGDAITLVSGRNFINGSATPFSLTGAGRWLVYSTNPASDTLNGLTSGFVRYGCTYGGSCPTGVTIPGSGNGVIYSYQPTLTITPAVQNITYGDTATTSGYGYTATGYLTSAAGTDSTADTLAGTLTATTAYSAGNDVGTYGLTYSSGTLTSALGYQFSYANNANAIVVGQRTLTTALTGSITKEYDGNDTATLASSNYTLTNVYGADALTISTTGGTYNNKNVGTGKTVTVTGLTLSGAKAANYTLASASVSGAIGAITQKALTITGLTASNKEYDGTLSATLTGTASFSGLVGGDSVTLGGTGTGVFANKNVGSNKAVTVTGYTISGTDSGNYVFAQPTGLTANITAKALTITGITATNKEYDGNATASFSGSAILSGLITGDAVTLGGVGTGTFVDKNVGVGKVVTVSGYTISGGDSGNYAFAQPTGLTANITTKALTITGITATNKEYDGNTIATLAGAASFSGLITGDAVTLGGTGMGAFANKNVGSNKAVTVTGYTISGGDSGNYTFAQPTGITADITTKALTITGITASNKVYDGTLSATLGGAASFSGLIGGDSVTLGGAGIGAFADKNVGVNKAVTVTGYTISGADSANYVFAQPTGITADITKRTLTVTADSKSIVYGNAVASGSISYSNFGTGDSAASLATVPTVASSLAGIQDVGTYAGNYTASGGVDGNYDFTYVAGDLTVTARPLTVVTDTYFISAGQPNPTFTGSNNLLGADAALISWVYAPVGYSGGTGIYTIAAMATDPLNRLANYSRTNSYGNFYVGTSNIALLPSAAVGGFTTTPTFRRRVALRVQRAEETSVDLQNGFEIIELTTEDENANRFLETLDVDLTVDPALLQRLGMVSSAVRI